MYKQTLCFIRHNDHILMLNRNNAPLQGLWTGVGGKMNVNESPLDCIVREIEEETTLVIDKEMIQEKGVVTWEETSGAFKPDGMFVFVAKITQRTIQTPLATEEGLLDWKPISWLLNPQNEGIDIIGRRFLPIVLFDQKPYHHQAIFTDDTFTAFHTHPFHPSMTSSS
ncbi:NUDIX hydrolase [Shouchella lonarensis]|uniref:Dihydroneopterin triphosphate pyrophosphatase n=1 Tax=Shouchella lonarensis TaxID=1464122 RepID=A0A1G6MZZ3_9BACI|nr:8-oxo-dGTP diphosphatase [Shouchella lonarensis]SDC60546.1 dihydroneopterin triphosphate pyrophosphatase [Shouchella lonarensis]